MAIYKIAIIGVLAAAAVFAAAPASARTLKVSVDTFKNGGMMDNKFAFCAPAAQGHTTGGTNLSPSISWSKGPRVTIGPFA
jgi:phosphatidylethanolamine-binding protein (PEBP) family uncharacterized protein